MPESVSAAIEAFAALPGIGSRSAERLTFRLLTDQNNLAVRLSSALTEMKNNVKECDQCCFLTDENTCEICMDTRRDTTKLCIVESPLDVLALERTHEFRGRYHVLHGVISPLRKVRPEDIRLTELYAHIEQLPDLNEVILGLGGSTESEATALYIMEQLRGRFSGHVTRLARGIPSGSELDFLDAGTLGRAMTERREW